MASEFKVEGIEDLMARLNSLGERVATRTENKALREGADVLREEMSRRSPQDTGSLAENIVKSRVKQAEIGKYIEVGPDKKHFYGLFHEFGTTKMPARPFIGPALEEEGKAVMNVMAGVLRKELAKR